MPVEILFKIYGELASDPRSLSRLARTCQGLHLAVTPILYRGIGTQPTQQLRVENLAISLLDSPARREHIQSMDTSQIYVYNAVDRIQRGVLSQIVEALFGIQAHEPGSPDSSNAITMAVVCLASNLTTLEIGHLYKNSGNTNLFLQKVNNRVTGPRVSCTLPKLTTLTAKPGFLASTINLHQLNGLLYAAPNLKSLSVDAATGGTSLTARLPNLASLCLDNSHLSYRGLRLLTRSCVNLTHFKLTHMGHHSATWLPVSPAQILDCLMPCRAGLKKLHLEPLVNPGYLGVDLAKPFPLLTTLKWFPALKQVAVDPRAIAPRSDGHGLVDLLRGCPALEGVVLVNVKEVTDGVLASIAHAAVDLMLW